ncbi:CPBP family intramembrane glutamic endopeptidase [Clostridium thermarum]|uniref:CPBP family intramembrane glutamic endopeptidase n=2 Tax=Clostridium thermarum TaxID=1716543 RepID=UPI00112000F2|nr:type II CAAX endopeptidase family protein [Clostridium thermarum]
MKSIFRANLFMLLLIVFMLAIEMFLVRDLIGLLGYVNLMAVHEYIALLIPAVAFILITKQSPKEVFRLNKIKPIDAAIAITIAFFAQPVASFLSQITALFFDNPVAQAFEILKDISYPKLLFMMAITPAICEELVTRGIVLHGYNKTSILRAALINGLVFSILHLDPQQSLYTFVLGVLFAYMVRITNSIWASVLCHFTFNGIQVTMLELSQMLKDKVGTEVIEAAQEAQQVTTAAQTAIMLAVSFVIALGSAAAIVGLLIYMNNRNKKAVAAAYSEGNAYDNINYEIDNERAYLFNNVQQQERTFIAYIPLVILIFLYIAIMMITS